jgi:large subunit ribosomal protein L32e
MRRQQRGWPKLVDVGYGKPASLRGLHPSGYREIIVNRPSDLAVIDPKKEVVRIAGNVGERKRLAIIDKAKELEIRVLNPVGIRKPEEEKEEAVEPEIEEPSVQNGEKIESEEASKEGSTTNNQMRVETE